MKKILSLLLIISTTAFGQNDRLTPELLWKLKRVSGTAVSTDGKEVVYGITEYNIEENKGNRNLYKIPVEGGQPTPLTDLEGSEFNELWRPDGKKIGFLATKSGAPQLWEMNPDGSGAKQITDIEGGIANFAYAPDMKHVFFTRNIKLDSTVQDIYPDLPHAEARVIDDLMYRHWDQWHDFKYSHIFVAPYSDGKVGEAKDIMEGQRYDSPLNPFGGVEEITWSPDGKWIAHTVKEKGGKEYAASTNSDIFLYNIETGERNNLTKGMMGYDKNPVFSPDGQLIAWESMEREGFESDKNRLFVYDLKTKQKRDLSKGWNQNAGHLRWAAKGDKIYFTSGINATEQIYEADLKSGKIRQITKGHHNYYSAEPAGEYLIGMRSSISYPVELYRIDPKTGEQTQLTFANKEILSNVKMGKVEERWITTTDGQKMLTWVIYPPDFDPNKKYPALLYAQGGPQAAVNQFFSYRWNFQLMAANDYIIVAPNRRGLPSFGQAWNDTISRNWGGQAMQDYLSAIDAVAKEPYVDENNLGAVGASFGGYSVYWLAGNHDGRFDAFVSHAGLFNLESWYGTTEEMFFANWDVGGPYWNEALREDYEKFSPHKYVKNWDTPILVIHGELDFRVSITEGIQAFQAAQLKGIPSKFLYYPNEGHWILQPQNGLLWHREFFSWLDRWLKDGE